MMIYNVRLERQDMLAIVFLWTLIKINKSSLKKAILPDMNYCACKIYSLVHVKKFLEKKSTSKSDENSNSIFKFQLWAK